jgi:hypothetical protein
MSGAGVGGAVRGDRRPPVAGRRDRILGATHAKSSPSLDCCCLTGIVFGFVGWLVDLSCVLARVKNVRATQESSVAVLFNLASKNKTKQQNNLVNRTN